MAFNKENNSYTIVFAAIMVIIVGSVLAYLASALSGKIEENERFEKQQNILYAMGINENNNEGSVNFVPTDRVETEFSKVRFKGSTEADTVYKGFKALQAQDVAEVIYFAVTRPPHVNIADVLMFCTAQANSTLVKKST